MWSWIQRHQLWNRNKYVSRTCVCASFCAHQNTPPRTAPHQRTLHCTMPHRTTSQDARPHHAINNTHTHTHSHTHTHTHTHTNDQILCFIWLLHLIVTHWLKRSLAKTLTRLKKGRWTKYPPAKTFANCCDITRFDQRFNDNWPVICKSF